MTTKVGLVTAIAGLIILGCGIVQFVTLGFGLLSFFVLLLGASAIYVGLTNVAPNVAVVKFDSIFQFSPEYSMEQALAKDRRNQGH